MLSGTRMEAFMANEASCLNDPDRPSHEPARGKVGVGHARGGDAVGASRKIEKVVHYGAVHFGASLVRRFPAANNMWCSAHSSEGCSTGEKALHRGGGTKNSKSDAKRCILMHGGRATLNRTRILGVAR